MRIAQVTPGLIPIPPNGWGAVEKIIWEYVTHLRKDGHSVDIVSIDEAISNHKRYDVIHVHMWNHALMLYQSNVAYVFTFHDHHAFAYGKSSVNYNNNLLAMQRAALAIVPAQYLVEYFDDIPVYLSHGIDLSRYYPATYEPTGTCRVLCVGNNGFGGDSSFDRKGFIYAVQAAKTYDFPITICGPRRNNEEFFEAHQDEFDYHKLTILYDLTDDELIEQYHSHDVLIHASSIEAGHPPLTLLEAAACGLPIISTDCAGELHHIRVERELESIITGIRMFATGPEIHRFKTFSSVHTYDWGVICADLASLYTSIVSPNMRSSMLRVYNKLRKRKNTDVMNINFIDGAFFELLSQHSKGIDVQFIDQTNNEVVYSTHIRSNQWAKCNRRWFTPWKIRVLSDDGHFVEHTFNLNGKRVLISMESSALGDTIAWIPYVEKFKNKHNCHIIVSTFHNDLFAEAYPELEFVAPGTVVDDLYSKFSLGLWYDDGQFNSLFHPRDTRTISLQQIACDILGLEYEELRPRLMAELIENIPDDFVCIAPYSTAQAKFWNNPTGWQEVVDYFRSKNKVVFLLSKEENGFMGNHDPVGVVRLNGLTTRQLAFVLSKCSLFVGLSSGLSWLAWAVGAPTTLISGFTPPDLEMQSGVLRVTNPHVCNSCTLRHFFDRGDWNWCPDHKNDSQRFICSTSIAGADVIRAIQETYGM